MTPNKELMARARSALDGKWGKAALATLIYDAVKIGFQFALVALSMVIPAANFGYLVIAGPLVLGFTGFFLKISRGLTPQLEEVFDGFKNFTTALVAFLLMALYILLWTLLLVIPGIVAALSYSLTFLIMVDDPGIRASAALDRSKELMMGRKWDLFCLYCRFIGWALLCIPTLGIGFFWLVPYIMVSVANFYRDAVGENVPPVVPQPVSP